MLLHFMFPHLAPYPNHGRHSLYMFLEELNKGIQHILAELLTVGKRKWLGKRNFDGIQDRGIMYRLKVITLTLRQKKNKVSYLVTAGLRNFNIQRPCQDSIPVGSDITLAKYWKRNNHVSRPNISWFYH